MNSNRTVFCVPNNLPQTTVPNCFGPIYANGNGGSSFGSNVSPAPIARGYAVSNGGHSTSYGNTFYAPYARWGGNGVQSRWGANPTFACCTPCDLPPPFEVSPDDDARGLTPQMGESVLPKCLTCKKPIRCGNEPLENQRLLNRDRVTRVPCVVQTVREVKVPKIVWHDKVINEPKIIYYPSMVPEPCISCYPNRVSVPNTVDCWYVDCNGNNSCTC